MAERMEIVKDYWDFKSYRAVVKTWEVNVSSVRLYVLNMANHGHPFLTHRVATLDKTMPNRKFKSALIDRTLNCQRISRLFANCFVNNRLLSEVFLNQLTTILVEQRDQKKLSFLTKRLLAHIKRGYLLPSPAIFLKLKGAPIVDVLEELDRECEKIRSSAIASSVSKRLMTDDTEF